MGDTSSIYQSIHHSMMIVYFFRIGLGHLAKHKLKKENLYLWTADQAKVSKNSTYREKNDKNSQASC